ncbi:hypothetical protein F4804DRAFT_335045 [Jackrogersella minutella]|nr:hypothetical protein F4804DRAFT_335045 [Jackrogersella minutella]
MSELALDRRTVRTPSRNELNAYRGLLGVLAGELGPELIDGWRKNNPWVRQFSFRRETDLSRLERLYIRKDWYQHASEWEILPTLVKTDHYRVQVTLKLPSTVDRGPGKWRLPPRAMQLRKHTDGCQEILDELEGMHHMTGWIRLNKAVQHYFELDKDNSPQTYKAKKSNIHKSRKTLIRKRNDTLNPKLERQIENLNTRELALDEWSWKNYSYNALAKNSILGEAPTQYFFSKVKIDSTNTSIEALRDDDGTRHTESTGILIRGSQNGSSVMPLK